MKSAEITFSHEGPLNLILDADDTLWDSNVHFLEAFEDFVRAFELAGLTHDRQSIKDVVRVSELELINALGYGREPYVAALHRAASRIVPETHRNAMRERVERIGERLLSRHCELLDGVAETIPALATRHRLILFTKGQRDEQLRKLDRSGLANHFWRVETPREKDVGSYRELLRDSNLPSERTFMIGNSPRSDINPSIAAGLRGAIFIPHPHTWESEIEELDRADPRIIELSSFRELMRLF
jgi:putative hydrolase of the HAD superfamily